MFQSEDRPFSEISSLPQLDETSLKIDWEQDRYDGPLSGLLSQAGQPFWFEYHCLTPERERCYRLYRLNATDHVYLDLWKLGEAIFQQDVRAVTNVPDYRDTAEFNSFMKKWRSFLDAFPAFEVRMPDAWCRSGANQAFYAIEIYRDIKPG